MTEAFGPIHPGEILREEFMVELGWDIDKVAKESGMEPDVIVQLVAEEADITEDMSKRLGKAFDTSEGFWFRLQEGYESNIGQLEKTDKKTKKNPKLSVNDMILVALSAGGSNVIYNTVHLQKIMFLMYKEINKKIGGPYFHFKPYKYGPFDAAVYRHLDELENEEYVEKIIRKRSDKMSRRYVLETRGFERGMRNFRNLPQDLRKSIKEISEWVISRDYKSLIEAIYQSYPEMKENSVWEDGK